jgi:hypothetical protein
MSAIVLPFPFANRVAFLRRQLGYLRSISPAAAERHVARQVDLQRASLTSKGIASEVIDAELSALERAIHAGLCWADQAPGGAA